MVGIKNVAVEKLFGQFDYNLHMPEQGNVDYPNLAIIYGENGSGKTTILEIIFNLLNPIPFSNQMTNVSKVSFSKIKVDFHGEKSIVVERKKTGICEFTILNDGKVVAQSNRFTRSEMNEEDHKNYRRYLSALDEMGLPTEILSSSRRIKSSQRQDEISEFNSERALQREYLYSNKARLGLELSDSTDYQLTIALQKVNEYFKQSAVYGTKKGQFDANSLYENLILGVLNSDSSNSNRDWNEVVQTLNKLSKTNFLFSKYGLVPKLNSDDIVSIIDKQDIVPKEALVGTIVDLYINSAEARHEAVRGLRDTIDLFVQTIDAFLNFKTLNYSLDNGFKIVTGSGEEIEPKMLSSGEKQLFLLFSNAILSREKASIFIIDEPEISLNVEWQRKIVAALLKCAGENTQILLATHSIELLSKYSQNVIPLKSQ